MDSPWRLQGFLENILPEQAITLLEAAAHRETVSVKLFNFSFRLPSPPDAPIMSGSMIGRTRLRSTILFATLAEVASNRRRLTGLTRSGYVFNRTTAMFLKLFELKASEPDEGFKFGLGSVTSCDADIQHTPLKILHPRENSCCASDYRMSFFVIIGFPYVGTSRPILTIREIQKRSDDRNHCLFPLALVYLTRNGTA